MNVCVLHVLSGCITILDLGAAIGGGGASPTLMAPTPAPAASRWDGSPVLIPPTPLSAPPSACPPPPLVDLPTAAPAAPEAPPGNDLAALFATASEPAAPEMPAGAADGSHGAQQRATTPATNGTGAAPMPGFASPEDALGAQLDALAFPAAAPVGGSLLD